MKLRGLKLGGPWYLSFVAVLVGFLAVGSVVLSQNVSPTKLNSPAPYDWSHRHVIFSAPATLENAVRIQSDVRYWHQMARRSANAVARPVPQVIASQVLERFDREDGEREFGPRANLITSIMSRRERRWFRRGKLITRDWGVPLGASATAGAGTFPAKFSFDVNTASCANDFVVFNTSLASTATQAGIVAFSNLYKTGCSSTPPTTSWAYKTTGTGDNCTACALLTSVVLALDGTQAAFVGSSSTGSFLYILKPKATEGTVGAPAQPTTSTILAATYLACRTGATSCLLSLPLGSAADTNSAPFYDYTNDLLYVGDNSGRLYKFTGVFRGTPTKLTSPWPVLVSSVALTAPVRDQVSGNIYVGDSSGVLRFVRDTGSTVGTCASGSPPCVGSNTVNAGAGSPIVDAPIVDSTTQKVFVFVGDDTSGSGGNAGVFQAPTDLSSSVEATLGPQFSNTLYDGAFDNTYYTNLASGNGHLYVCGNVSALGFNTVALFRVSFSGAGVMNNMADTTSLTLSNTTFLTNPGTCSPATEISASASSDLLFLSLTQNGLNSAGCGTVLSNNGCLFSVALPTATPFTFPTISATKTLPASGGTSGIVVDNIVTTPAGTSQIYFTPLSNASTTFPCGGNTTAVGCAIQASQAGLN